MRREGTLVLPRALLLAILLVVGIGVAPALASNPYDCCILCHVSVFNVHGDFDHTAAPGSGPVSIFADTDHDDAGWVGDKPYFDVTVDCTLCHNTDVMKVHGDDCATCHPTPYDTVWRAWNQGCQQGGCHATFHDESTSEATVAHLPFEDAYDPTNDCSRCHGWEVAQDNCLNCHAANAPDLTPPTTTSDALAMYNGVAKIGFSITDNGKVGVGRTFYQLDGGPTTAAGKYLTVTAPGSHELVFWSKDQYGNTELVPNTALFNIVVDNTPPVTTSDAQASYVQGAVINLNASDAGSGVKATYFTLNGGETQTGNQVVVPAMSGTIPYTLTFWSEDWVGNVEDPPHTVNFTVTGGTGTLRLVWGNSDNDGSPCGGDPDAAAVWRVYLTGSSTVVSTGSGACPGWSGVADVPVPVGPTPYSVVIDWYDSFVIEDWDQTVFSNVQVTTPGQVVRLSY